MLKNSEKSKKNLKKRKEQILVVNSIKQLIEKGKYNIAEKELDKFLNIYPDDYYALYHKAFVLNKLGDYEEAIDTYNKVIDYNGDNKYAACFGLAKVYTAQGEFSKAFDLYQVIIDESPYNDADAMYLEQGTILDSQGRFLEAIKVLDKALEINPDNVKVKLTKSRALYSSSKHNEAFVLLNSIETDDPELNNSKNIEISKFYIVVGEYERAIEILKNVHPTQQSNYFMSIAYFELGKFDEVEELIYGNSNLKDDNLTKVLKGRLAEEQGRIEEAKDIYRTLVEEKEATAILRLGLLEATDKNYKEARNLFTINSEIDSKVTFDSIINLCYLDILEEKYQDIVGKYNKVKKTYKTIDEDRLFDLERCYAVACKKLDNGIPIKDEYKKFYGFNQLENYSVEDAKKHTKKHLNPELEACLFDKKIDIDELFKIIPSKLNEETFARTNGNDVYMIDYPNIGTVDGKVSNTLCVVTLPHAKDILTMYPTLNKKRIVKKPKKNIYSRVDKFNQKYGMKK